MDELYDMNEYNDDINYSDDETVSVYNGFNLTALIGRESNSSASSYSFSNSDDGVSVGSDENSENEYKYELMKALDRLNNAVNKLGEINTKSDSNCIFCCEIYYFSVM